MTAPKPASVIPIGVMRARHLLQDMLENPFFILVFKEDGVQGLAKGLDADTTEMVESIMSALLVADEET